MPRRPQHLTTTGRRLGTAAALIALAPVAGPGAAAQPPPALERVTGTVLRTAAESGPDATWLVTAQGRLHVDATALAGVPDGARVTAELARGRSVRRVLSFRVAAPRAPGGGAAGARAAARTVDHDVTVALVTPPGARRDAMTIAALARTVDGPVAAYWRAQSEGALTLHVGRTLDWYATPYACADTWKLWDDVGHRAGYRPGPNRHLLVYVTSAGALPGCWSGLATVGADRSSGGTMYVRAGLASLVAHEFGHNLGLRHSQGLHCGAASDGAFARGAWPASCQAVSYGDWYDVMGTSWRELGTLSAAQAIRLGVYGPGRVRTVTSTAVAVLRPLSAHRGLTALRVPVPGAAYVLEYRAATGRDAWLAGHPYGLGAGLLVRRDQPDPGHAGETLLLDASPTAPGGAADTDGAAEPGRPVALDGGRVVVTVLSQGGGHAKVRVELAGRDRAAWPGSRLRTRTGRPLGRA